MPGTQVKTLQVADGSLTDTDIATANIDGVAATPSMRTLGSGATQAAAGDHTHSGMTTGAGVNTRVAIWSGAGTLDSDANLTWDGTNLDVNGHIRLTDSAKILKWVDTGTEIGHVYSGLGIGGVNSGNDFYVNVLPKDATYNATTYKVELKNNASTRNVKFYLDVDRTGAAQSYAAIYGTGFVGLAVGAGNRATTNSMLEVWGQIAIYDAAPKFLLRDSTASAKSLLLTVDANFATFQEEAGTDILTLDLANVRVGIGTAAPDVALHIIQADGGFLTEYPGQEVGGFFQGSDRSSIWIDAATSVFEIASAITANVRARNWGARTTLFTMAPTTGNTYFLGSVGVGVSPSAKLHVAADMRVDSTSQGIFIRDPNTIVIGGMMTWQTSGGTGKWRFGLRGTAGSLTDDLYITADTGSGFVVALTIANATGLVTIGGGLTSSGVTRVGAGTLTGAAPVGEAFSVRNDVSSNTDHLASVFSTNFTGTTATSVQNIESWIAFNHASGSTNGYGIISNMQHRAAGNLGSVFSFYSMFLNQPSTGTVAALYNFYSYGVNPIGGAGGTITDAYQFFAKAQTMASGITNRYSFYAEDVLNGTLNYAIYTNRGDIRLMSNTADKMGVWGAAPVARPAAYTQTYATATRTHSNFTATSIAAATATAAAPAGGTGTAAGGWSTAANRNIAINTINELRTWSIEMDADFEALLVDVANLKQVVNSLIDDHQAIGFAG